MCYMRKSFAYKKTSITLSSLRHEFWQPAGSSMENCSYFGIPRASSAARNEIDRMGRKTVEDLIENLDTDVIGSGSGFWGPLGWNKYTYLDHTASGKGLHSIENFIQSEVLPHYANTHTTVSHTSLQTTNLRAEARTIIKLSVGACDDDEVIFCGSGATAAVHKLLHCIAYPKTRKLIVFVGPFEHHSNILPWRESASKIIQVPMDVSTGQIDIQFLRSNLKKRTRLFSKNQLIIGCFSAGSNITGVVTDDVEITEIMHEHGGLAIWDYAAAAPHVDINMNPGGRDGRACKDAIFFSGHKFLGGPQTPGVLVVKKHVLSNPTPHGVGGGTVLYTTRREHHYLQEITEREEGGTPDIIGSIRLGLVFRLRNIIGIKKIVEKEAALCRKALQAWRDVPEIHILGSLTHPRLPIISFMVRHQRTGYFLHHNFVVALLNDLFGIQCRGGCMCAGPYAQALLGVNDKLASYYSEQLKQTQNSSSLKHGTILKPGFVRISFNFHTSQEELQFVIDVVKLVARHGWKLLPCYNICRTTGTFQLPKKTSVTTFEAFDPLLYSSGVSPLATSSLRKKKGHQFTYRKCLEAAKSVLTCFEYPFDLDYAFVSELLSMADSDYRQDRMRHLRWFMVSYESFLLLYENHWSSYRKTNMIRSLEPFKPILQGEFSNPNEVSSRKGSIPSLLQEVWTPCSNDHHHQSRSSSRTIRKSIWEKLCNQFELDKKINDNFTAARISLSSSGFEDGEV